MKKVLILGITILSLTSCRSIQLGINLDPKTNYFYTHRNNGKIITEISVDADTLKSLLIVNYPNDLEIGKNLKFFKEVMTLDQFEESIIKAGLVDEIKTIRNRAGQHRAAILFRPFVILEHQHGLEAFNFRVGLKLYDPKKEITIFENEMEENLIGPPHDDHKFWFPLYNGLLDYLRKQQ